jgi:hypothetical protein
MIYFIHKIIKYFNHSTLNLKVGILCWPRLLTNKRDICGGPHIYICDISSP